MANRLHREKSPYLLQHKDNPVDWWAWCEEAFEEARARDIPVFLSIGYATCHWCHVMERESFEDGEVAQLLNAAFVNIKVDREERPDVDAVYMKVCQLLTGRGGWPLTIIMTPEKEPFFAATYIPKHSRHGIMGMMDLVPRVRHAWTEGRSQVQANADSLTGALQQSIHRASSQREAGIATLERAFLSLQHSYDSVHGGFGGAPKFPAPHNLRFLLRYWKRTGNADALRMVEETLRHMRRGGIFDHVGYGFHRYATDREWKVPHFEKMLYDQAMLALAYTDAFQATGDAQYRETARAVLTYVLRDLASPEGGFHCAEDADSEGREGKFYLWRREELFACLGEELALLVAQVYHVEDGGNFLDEVSRERTGENILHQPEAEAGQQARLEQARQLLFDYRERRIRPAKDDKILADWNGLMIAALARAARVFDDPSYSRAATAAWDFLSATMMRANGRLLHRWRDGEAGIEGMLDDYAFCIWGLLELYATTFEAAHLETALALTATCDQHFSDPDEGAFFLTADDGESLIVRPKEAYDGAAPSGNSIMAMNLLRLARLTGNADLERNAFRVIQCFVDALDATPTGFTAMLSALDYGVGPSCEVIVAGAMDTADTQVLLKALAGIYLPNMVTLVRPEAPSGEPPAIDRLAPQIAAYATVEGKAAAYVCRDYECSLPVTDPEAMLTHLL